MCASIRIVRRGLRGSMIASESPSIVSWGARFAFVVCWRCRVRDSPPLLQTTSSFACDALTIQHLPRLSEDVQSFGCTQRK